MSIPPTSYEDFSASNQATVEAGGPWIFQSVSANMGYGWLSRSWCGGYCLEFMVSHLNTPPIYHGSIVTNISVNLANYGGATNLDFTWSYWPLYCGSNTTAGFNVPITSQVGDAVFTEAFPAVDYDTFFSDNGGHQWDNASKISHNGSTSVVRGSDPNHGYIALKMNVTMGYSAADHDEYLNFYVKSIGFLITTPSSSSTSSTSSTTPGGVVAGAVVGALAFIVLFILAVCLFRRRHKNKENSADDTVIFTEQVNHEAPTPLEVPVPLPHFATRYSAQPSSSSFLRPVSFDACSPYGPPPIYGPDGLTGQDRAPLAPSSPELARFAATNRDSINENLEARLQAAGYLPTEDPSKLAPDEWKNEYGITKLELTRLQNLYARTQQDQPQ